MVILFTDWPIEALGDEPGQDAPIRRCTLLTYNGKDTTVLCQGVVGSVPLERLYTQPGRLGQAPPLGRRMALALMRPPVVNR